MNTMERRKLDLATRVLEFTRAHPLEDPIQVEVVKELEARLTRADAIVARELSGRASARGARARRFELRGVLHGQLLGYLTVVGEVAAKDRADLAEQFRLPSKNASYRTYLAAVKKLLASAIEQKELLMTHGMSPSLLDDLDRLVKESEAASLAALTGRRDHIGARNDLALACQELMEDVRKLEGIYRYRFGNDQLLMAEWDAVRFLLGVPVKKPEPPPAGGIAPAA